MISRADVLADISGGFVTREAAERDYGVIIADGAVDVAATEAVRARPKAPAATFGFGPDRERWEAVFTDAVEVLAKAIGVELDAVTYERELGLATKDIDLGWMRIAEGTVCGINGTWAGVAGGRTVVEMGLVWRLGDAMEPDWPVLGGHRVEITAVPNLRMQVEYIDPTDPVDVHAHTANPAVNAIPAVVAAPPGLATVDELPLITAGSARA